jgi:parvulin-like peptidyl-prolyl isomerase
LALVALLSGRAVAQDYPMGPGNGTMPWAPVGPAPGLPGNGYGIVPGAPTRPTASVRPELWPNGLPAQGPLAAGPSPVVHRASWEDARPCAGAQILARVGNDVVLTSDVLQAAAIDELMDRFKDRIPASQLDAQRKSLVQEVTAGINDLVAHINEPDPAARLDPQRKMLIQQLIALQIQTKIVFQDFQRTVSKENLPNIQEAINRRFDEVELPHLLKRENVPGRQELEWKLRSQGSSLDRERRIFMERAVAGQWRQEQVKVDRMEVTHEEMLAWYNAHLADFEKPARARWEELMVSFSKYRTKEDAYAALAHMGNQVLAGVPLAEIAKARSDGPTSPQGGQRDWTNKGSLIEELDRALFDPQLAVGRLTPIVEGKTGLHIVRVVQRQDATRTPFATAQPEIQEKIRKERLNKQYMEYLKKVQQQIPTWTIFDDPKAKPRMAEAEQRRY